MLNCFNKRPIYINKSLSDYCKKTTDESIRKLTEKYNKERYNPKKFVLIDDNDDKNNNFNFLNLIIFLSISSITICLYKRLN